jgi:soluble P-type ATPase
MLHVEIPGGDDLRLEHLVMDVNGTLSDRGQPIDGVRTPLRAIAEDLAVHLLSADTFGTAEALAAELGAEFHRIQSGEDKCAYIEQLGPRHCVAVGNGANDVPMFRAAGLSIAVLGPEGTHTDAIGTATIVCRSIAEALDLLLVPRALTATLRS